MIRLQYFVSILGILRSTTASQSQGHIPAGPPDEPCRSPSGNLAQQGVLQGPQLMFVLRFSFPGQMASKNGRVFLCQLDNNFTCKAQGLQTTFVSSQFLQNFAECQRIGLPLPEAQRMVHPALPSPTSPVPPVGKSLGD